jgi:hypothetical protein
MSIHIGSNTVIPISLSARLRITQVISKDNESPNPDPFHCIRGGLAEPLSYARMGQDAE